MKKISALLLGLMLVTTPFAFSQEKDTEKDNRQMASNVFSKKDYSQWSLYMDLGLNTFMGDMSVDFGSTFKNPAKHWNIGGGVEYTVNPMFSLGLNYTYLRIGAEDNGGSFVSNVHNIYPFMSVNLLNYALFSRNSKWDLWLSAGAGYAHYTPELTYKDAGRVPNWEDQPQSKSSNDTGSGIVPLGVELSYDITSRLAIALKGRYILYMDDNLEGAKAKIREMGDDPYGRKNYTYSGVNSDAIATVDLSLRWKITDKAHMRKLTWKDYLPQVQNDDLDYILARLDDLEDKVDNIDTTPIIITENNTTIGASAAYTIEPIFIYFDFDKYNFKHEALAEILKIATILYDHQDLDVEIIGYTDMKGTDPYNERLSKRRADAIKTELVNIWQISPDRIIEEGRGKALTPRPELKRYHSINRRCEVRFYQRK